MQFLAGLVLVACAAQLGLASALRNSSKFIIIASGQRSASTELGMELGRANPCIWNMNEFFSDGEGQTGVAYFMEPTLFGERRKRALEALEAAHAGACAEIDNARALKGEEACGLDRCALAVKLFSSHLVPTGEMVKLLASPDASVVVLERDPVERHCSLKHAHLTGDWATVPSASRGAVPCHACRTERCRVVRAQFGEAHAAWFSFVRCATARKRAGLQVLELPFKTWTDPHRGKAALRSVLGLGSGSQQGAASARGGDSWEARPAPACTYEGDWKNRAAQAASAARPFATDSSSDLVEATAEPPRTELTAAKYANMALGKLGKIERNLPSVAAKPDPSVTDVSLVAPSAVIKGGAFRVGRPVFFMHLHKAAGSSLCELAVTNKQRAAGVKRIGTKEFGFNCNIRGDDPGHLGLGVDKQDSTYGQAEGRFSCAARASYMKKNSFTFSAIERWIFPQEICTETFIYMTCLRNPIARIKSSVKFHTKQTEAVVVGWATNHHFEASSPISTGSPSVDNFYIRSFAGRSVYMKKLGEVTAHDLTTAKDVLSKFELVLILEKFDRDLVQLRKYLGWNTKIGKAKSTAGKTVVFTSAQELKLMEINTLDFQFYNFADKMAESISKLLT